MKKIGPNTEPWRTTVASGVGDDLQPEHETVKVLFDRRKPRGNCSGDQIIKMKQNGVVYLVKSCKEVKKDKTGDLLFVHGPDEVIM